MKVFQGGKRLNKCKHLTNVSQYDFGCRRLRQWKIKGEWEKHAESTKKHLYGLVLDDLFYAIFVLVQLVLHSYESCKPASKSTCMKETSKLASRRAS